MDVFVFCEGDTRARELAVAFSAERLAVGLPTTLHLTDPTHYAFGDIHCRGEYPGYLLRMFREEGVELDITDSDREILKNTVDFVSFSYYMSVAATAAPASAAPTFAPAQPTAPAATGPEPSGTALAVPSGTESAIAAAAPAETANSVPIASPTTLLSNLIQFSREGSTGSGRISSGVAPGRTIRC